MIFSILELPLLLCYHFSMTVLLGIHSLSKSYGTQILFKDLSLTVSEGDHLALIGPNGSGKSTLLKIIAESENADDGYISRRRALRIGYATQAPEFPDKPLEEIMLEGRSDSIDMLTKARTLLSRAQFTDFSLSATTLSGGWKKRLDIAKALMDDPDILLLDEPTNHLDLEGIEWLEKFLLRERLTFIVISHDRYFLDKIANRIIEINRCFPGGMLHCEGTLSDYMEQKEDFLKGQAQQERSLASTARNEVEWLRRSPKARTTKSLSRIQRAYALLDELSAVKTRNKQDTVSINFSASERETRKLLVAKNIAKSMGGKLLFKNVDITLSPGTRIGIVGKNGTGKTTLLKIMAGSVTQDMGTVKYANDIRLVYFDQHRDQIPPQLTLKEALSPHGEMVNYRGQDIHVNGWAKRFLFSQERLQLPIGCLSGGERARIQIAKLMLEPADILFLDEPTNDLDIPTLEVLEKSLIDFPGAVVLISHDRCLMDRVCTEIVGLGVGNEEILFADYEQWEAAIKEVEKKSIRSPKEQKEVAATPKPSKKLSFKEQKELDAMEENILKVEQEMEMLQQQLKEPAVQTDAQRSLDLYTRLSEAQRKHETLYERWQALEDKQP